MIKDRADIKNLAIFMDYVREFAQTSGFTIDKGLQRIELSVEEVLVNIINYAFNDHPGYITISCSYSNDLLTIKIIDNGKPFNLMDQEDPDINLPADQREVGGLGIFLVKNLMDDVQYYRENDENILLLTKKMIDYS